MEQKYLQKPKTLAPFAFTKKTEPNAQMDREEKAAASADAEGGRITNKSIVESGKKNVSKKGKEQRQKEIT